MIKHVKSTRLFVCRGLAAAALGCLALTAHAGYAQATPPAAWSAGGGAGGSFTGTKAANGATFLSGSVSTNASLNVGGRAVSMPATMRFAANAPRVAASAIMLHPGIRTAASIAGWLGLAGLFYDPISGLWKSDNLDFPPSTGLMYYIRSEPDVYYSTPESACQYYAQLYVSFVPDLRRNGVANPVGQNCYISYEYRGNSDSTNWKSGSTSTVIQSKSCPSGWYVTPAGCVQSPQPQTVTEEKAVEDLIKHPMPVDVPQHIPEPLPVEIPEIQPVFIPTGNPVANPSYNPSAPPSPENQPYVQPGTKVTPAPAPGAPWQVDTVPVNRPTPTPQGSTEPSTEPSPETPREPQKEERDFCDKNPDSLACAEGDIPEQETPTGNINISYEYVDIFGNGSCPSDSYLNTHGQNLKVWDWAATCDNVQSYFRPILIACCAFAAFVIVSAGAKE